MAPVVYKFEPFKPLPEWRLPDESKYILKSKGGLDSPDMIAAAYKGLQDWCVGAIGTKQTEIQKGKRRNETEAERFKTSEQLGRFAFKLVNLKEALDKLNAEFEKADGKSASAGSGDDDELSPEVFEKVARLLGLTPDADDDAV